MQLFVWQTLLVYILKFKKSVFIQFIQTGKNKLTVPKYSNVCDALCHMRINRKMGICPEVKEGEPKPILPENYKWVECYCNLNIHIYPRIPSLCSVKGCTWCIALCTIASNCSHITTNSTMCSVKGCTNNYDNVWHNPSFPENYGSLHDQHNLETKNYFFPFNFFCTLHRPTLLKDLRFKDGT